MRSRSRYQFRRSSGGTYAVWSGGRSVGVYNPKKHTYSPFNFSGGLLSSNYEKPVSFRSKSSFLSFFR